MTSLCWVYSHILVSISRADGIIYRKRYVNSWLTDLMPLILIRSFGVMRKDSLMCVMVFPLPRRFLSTIFSCPDFTSDAFSSYFTEIWSRISWSFPLLVLILRRSASSTLILFSEAVRVFFICVLATFSSIFSCYRFTSESCSFY
jgi:hypothetical protein